MQKIDETKNEIKTEVFATINEVQQRFFELNNPGGLSSFANFVVPEDHNERIKKAKELRNIGLVDRMERIRQNYILPVKEFKCKAARQQKFYNENVLPLVQRIASQTILEYDTTGEVFLHYGFKEASKNPMYLLIEDGESITPVSVFGNEVYDVKISSKMKYQVQKLKTILEDPNSNIKDKKTANDVLAMLPIYLQDMALGRKKINDKITLTYTSMYRMCNQKMDYDLRPIPPILRIMKSLVLREFLKDTDFANAFGAQKTSIIHTRCGVGTGNKPWPGDRVEKMHKLMTERSPGQTFVTTPGDVEISVVDSKLTELFDPKKYEECNADILNYYGISVVFVPSESAGINNSTVLVSLKNFEQEIIETRKVFEQFLKVFFENINEKFGFREIPKVQYCHTNIRDSKELIGELEFLFDKGVISFYDLVPIFDYDLETQLETKKKAWENRNILAPVWENSQGLNIPLVPQEVQTLKYLGLKDEEIKKLILQKYNYEQQNIKPSNNKNTNQEVVKQI